MSDRTKVYVIQYGDCKNLTLRWADHNGRLKRKSAGTSNRREAEKRAAVLESELNSGRYRATSKLLWAEFRVRYENEVIASLANKTALKVAGVFNVLERNLPAVANGKLRDLTPQRISAIQTSLREQGRAESTIAGYLAHLRAALAWAVDMGFLSEIPRFKKPKRVKRSGSGDPMKGRPITKEEFERMLGAVSKTLTPCDSKGKPIFQKAPTLETVASWQHLLRGLWWSGLRLGEALNLSWESRPGNLCVDLGGRRPMLRIPGALQKSGKDQLLPVAPEFAELLLATPPRERRGRVFRPLSKLGTVPTIENISKTVAMIGKAAGVVTNRETKWVNEPINHPKTGKPTGETQRVQREVPKYASAHDLRRSFGERWAVRVMPQVLMVLMRHESIQTTMRYYVGRNAQTTADAAWAAYENQTSENESGTVLGTVGPEVGQEAEEFDAVTVC